VMGRLLMPHAQEVLCGILEATEFPLLNLEPFKIYKDLVAQCKCLELMSLILC